MQLEAGGGPDDGSEDAEIDSVAIAHVGDGGRRGQGVAEDAAVGPQRAVDVDAETAQVRQLAPPSPPVPSQSEARSLLYAHTLGGSSSEQAGSLPSWRS